MSEKQVTIRELEQSLEQALAPFGAHSIRTFGRTSGDNHDDIERVTISLPEKMIVTDEMRGELTEIVERFFGPVARLEKKHGERTGFAGGELRRWFTFELEALDG